jgi:hypothetical protein
VDIRRLIETLAAREEALRRGGQFLAPCVGGGRVRVSLDGLVQTFRMRPRGFEGWGVFEAIDERTARLVGEATLAQVAGYLTRLKFLRVHLVERVRGRTWLAWPVNAEDARRRFGLEGELRVHLVSEGARFEGASAHTDGRNWFYGEPDRRTDARACEHLRELLRQGIAPRLVNGKGITPEMRSAYEMATRFVPAFARERAHQATQKRLRDALALNGGQLAGYEDEGENWRVSWRTRDGARHVSTVAKGDLTIVCAGICLSGQDADFDLHTLVGVVEHACEDY